MASAPQGGYQAAVAAVVGALRAGDVAAGLPAWGEEATCAAQLLLSTLNRTSAGGRRAGREFYLGTFWGMSFA